MSEIEKDQDKDLEDKELFDYMVKGILIGCLVMLFYVFMKTLWVIFLL